MDSVSGIQSRARSLCLVCMLSHFPSCSASLSSELGFVSPQLRLTDCHSHRWREAFLPSAMNWSPFLWHPDFWKSMKTLILFGATRDVSGFPRFASQISIPPSCLLSVPVYPSFCLIKPSASCFLKVCHFIFSSLLVSLISWFNLLSGSPCSCRLL